MPGYLAAAGEGAPSVVVVHDWYGQFPHVRSLCDDLAGRGLSALAVDLYDGATTTDPAVAERLMHALDGAAAHAALADAVRTMRRSGVMASRVSAVGFSMGGQLTLSAAKRGLFDSAVAYYASLGGDDVPMPCPVQLHLAGVVDFEPPDLPQQFVEAVRAAGGSAQAHVYEGTDHSFANADVELYDAGAAAAAWNRTVDFLGA